jgi:ribosomal protein S18 acetylase RimI-like enzyme
MESIYFGYPDFKIKKMNLAIKNLLGIPFDDLNRVFCNAFSDYAIDVSYMNKRIMENRAIKNGYDPEVSAGIFDQDKLVGFTLTGVGDFMGKYSAFDIMTGIEKKYRGLGMAAKMFDYIRTAANNRSVENFYLEVLQVNNSAIKAYQRSGFEITRSFDCFELYLENFRIAEPPKISLKFNQLDKKDIGFFETFLSWPPSWENSFSSVKRIPDDVLLFEAANGSQKIGLIVYYPTLNWIMSLLVHPDYQEMGVKSELLQHLIKKLDDKPEVIKMINVQHDDETFIQFLLNSGFDIYTRQFEMKCGL